jgi:hydroxymethylglutaryl-CoA lyase
MKKFINVIDVTLRDGIQTEKRILTTHQKFNILNGLIRAGVTKLEVTSFVKNIPQFEDNKHFCRNLVNFREVTYSALVPNVRGYNDMINSGNNIQEIVLFVSATNKFNKKNINATTIEAFERFKDIVKLAKKDNLKIRGSISCCFDCPYEGETSVESVIDVIRRYKDLGVDVIDIADTIGSGTTDKLRRILDDALKIVDVERVTGHFHDTNNNALQLVEKSLEYGITTFHSSLGGLGGCPYSSKIVGNLSTEKLIDYLHSRGYKTNIELDKIKRLQQIFKV